VNHNLWGANGLIGRREGSTDVYFAYDPMGNVANTIDKFGAVSNVGFDAYGTRYGDTSYATVGYGGQWGYYTDADAADKLILCTHRYYDPATGIRMGERPERRSFPRFLVSPFPVLTAAGRRPS